MPLVSVVVPCYNEEASIRQLLDALYAQTFRRDEMEVIIADGGSRDGTRAKIGAFQKAHPDLPVRVVVNPARNIPAGLNTGLRAAQGKWIVRLDGHSSPQPDYVARCVAALEAGRGAIVGGRWRILPRSAAWQARAIAAAAAHPLGAGDARYRIGGTAQAVDTVPFGAFEQALVARIGPFDETLLSNEDYEFNTRARLAGETVWFDPEICSQYLAAGSLAALARQYWRYGFWKARMLQRYPQTLRWRQLLPPVFVLGVLLLGLLALGIPLLRPVWLAGVGLYILVLAVGGVQAALKAHDWGLALGVPLALATMHWAWGLGLWWSLGKTIGSTHDNDEIAS
jgi:glycosyltransferase involved in cell wall biosynthesis